MIGELKNSIRLPKEDLLIKNQISNRKSYVKLNFLLPSLCSQLLRLEFTDILLIKFPKDIQSQSFIFCLLVLHTMWWNYFSRCIHRLIHILSLFLQVLYLGPWATAHGPIGPLDLNWTWAFGRCFLEKKIKFVFLFKWKSQYFIESWDVQLTFDTLINAFRFKA